MENKGTICYDATLDDISEAAVRHYLRSRGARNARVRGSLSGAVVCGLVAAYFMRKYEPPVLALGALLGSLIAALINYFTFSSMVSRRIRKHMKVEWEGKLPAPTTYRFEGKKLACDHLGTTIAFPLSELKTLTDDGERLEVSFGDAGMCLIPHRAFGSAEDRSAFVARIKAGAGD